MVKAELAGIQTIIFDYDGTIHDSTKNYIFAFKRAYAYLVANGKAEPKNWEDAEITRWLGFSAKDMWANFMPDLEPEFQQTASRMIGDTLQQKVQGDEAVLYPGALDTLAYLKQKGYTLIFLSNCKHEYMEAHRRAFQLDRYFSGLYCTEDYDFIPKYDIFARFQNKYEPEYLVVGDRVHDFEIGTVHQLKTIACNYGYGTEEELAVADIRIDDIRELTKIL